MCICLDIESTTQASALYRTPSRGCLQGCFGGAVGSAGMRAGSGCLKNSLLSRYVTVTVLISAPRGGLEALTIRQARAPSHLKHLTMSYEDDTSMQFAAGSVVLSVEDVRFRVSALGLSNSHFLGTF